jgi:hypothetical protein
VCICFGQVLPHTVEKVRDPQQEQLQQTYADAPVSASNARNGGPVSRFLRLIFLLWFVLGERFSFNILKGFMLVSMCPLGQVHAGNLVRCLGYNWTKKWPWMKSVVKEISAYSGQQLESKELEPTLGAQ